LPQQAQKRARQRRFDLGSDLAPASAVCPVGIGQRRALCLELGEQFIAVLV
jgi:hypothetical protein